MRINWCLALAALAWGSTAHGQSKFDPAKAEEGETYRVSGQVVDSQLTGDKVTVVLAQPRKDGWTNLFVVPLDGASPSDFKVGRAASFHAVFFGRQDSKSEKTSTSYFRNGSSLEPVSVDTHPSAGYKLGKRASVTGLVAHDGEIQGVRAIVLMKEEDGVITSYAFIVRDKNFAKPKPMSEVTLSGEFLLSKKDEQHGIWVHVFDNAKMGKAESNSPEVQPEAKSGAPGWADPAPAKAENSFNAALNGWRFQGTVEIEGQATAVFTKEDRTRHVRSGATLDEGVQVVEVGSGWVKVKSQGSVLRLSPW
ncbi:MAG: hypothetical protein KF884_12520 [Fimbriimonadaceae bacterium]|nr:MAG: hypothetical protein KF884_12520 [Fimbriimonadaceae bacterium]